MALSLMLRNAGGRCNATAGFLMTARLAPFKTYSAVVAAQRGATVKSLALIKNVAPLPRNIALSAPRMAAAGNYTLLWTAERIISAALLGVIPAAFVFPSQALDAIMAVSIVLHTHWGVEAMVTDYVRPIVVGPVLPKVAHGSLILLSIASLGGLFYIIYNDIGIAKTIKQIWNIQGAGGNAAVAQK